MSQTLSFRPKSFTYRTSAEWLGKRNVRFSAPTKDSIVVSNPTEFRGEEGSLSPEELFIGAVETCLLISFASLIEKSKLPVVSYCSETEGTLQDRGGAFRFTRVTIKPTVVISDPSAVVAVRETLEKAHRDCMIGNSQRAEIVVDPTIILSEK